MPIAVVADADDRLAALARGDDRDLAPIGRVLGGVVQQVDEDLLEADGVRVEEDRLGRAARRMS